MIIPDEVETLIGEFNMENKMPLTRYALETYPWMFADKYAPLKAVVDAEQFLKELVGAYNYDNTDIMTDYFDVRFYGGVTVIGDTYYNRYYK